MDAFQGHILVAVEIHPKVLMLPIAPIVVESEIEE